MQTTSRLYQPEYSPIRFVSNTHHFARRDSGSDAGWDATIVTSMLNVEYILLARLQNIRLGLHPTSHSQWLGRAQREQRQAAALRSTYSIRYSVHTYTSARNGAGRMVTVPRDASTTFHVHIESTPKKRMPGCVCEVQAAKGKAQRRCYVSMTRLHE